MTDRETAVKEARKKILSSRKSIVGIVNKLGIVDEELSEFEGYDKNRFTDLLEEADMLIRFLDEWKGSL